MTKEQVKIRDDLHAFWREEQPAGKGPRVTWHGKTLDIHIATFATLQRPDLKLAKKFCMRFNGDFGCKSTGCGYDHVCLYDGCKDRAKCSFLQRLQEEQSRFIEETAADPLHSMTSVLKQLQWAREGKAEDKAQESLRVDGEEEEFPNLPPPPPRSELAGLDGRLPFWTYLSEEHLPPGALLCPFVLTPKARAIPSIESPHVFMASGVRKHTSGSSFAFGNISRSATKCFQTLRTT